MNDRDEVYGYGDRFDELYAFNRTVRKGRFKYSRNFQPYHSKSLYAFYRYKQAAFREWKELYAKGMLNEIQKRFFEPQGAEELYDLSVDPYETNYWKRMISDFIQSVYGSNREVKIRQASVKRRKIR